MEQEADRTYSDKNSDQGAPVVQRQRNRVVADSDDEEMLFGDSTTKRCPPAPAAEPDEEVVVVDEEVEMIVDEVKHKKELDPEDILFGSGNRSQQSPPKSQY